MLLLSRRRITIYTVSSPSINHHLFPLKIEWNIKDQHTPPSPSLTTNTNPFLSPRNSSHFLYNVPKLTPCSSKLYTKFHSSHNCNLAGTSNRTSSANALLSNRALSAVLSLQPFNVTGYSGGGWNGDAVRCRGL